MGLGLMFWFFIDWSQRGKLFYFLLCPSWAVFFIGCMPSGINFLHRTQKADFKGNGRQGICGIFIWNTQFLTENCGRLPVEYPGNRLTKDAGTCRFSWPPYLRDEKCWSYTKGRKPKEMLTVRIWPESPPNLDNLSTMSDILSLQGQWHTCCNK